MSARTAAGLAAIFATCAGVIAWAATIIITSI
jgi:hypothetical protein